MSRQTMLWAAFALQVAVTVFFILAGTWPVTIAISGAVAGMSFCIADRERRDRR